ncbi:MAG: bifunctional phosphoserine phosphatase/homoserine phosphotransferase ThrH [Spirochaetota bacterium]
MNIVCLDLEGVLIPEMWIAVAEATGTSELRLTTRDISDYDELMQRRIAILRREGISLPDIQAITRDLAPLEGAAGFLQALRSHCQVAILSDTFVQFVAPIMARLGHPFLLCNELVTDSAGMIVDYRLRQPNGKKPAVIAFRELNLRVQAVGDSFNDIEMLREADRGYLFRPSDTVVNAHPDLPRTDDHRELLEMITSDQPSPVE